MRRLTSGSAAGLSAFCMARILSAGVEGCKPASPLKCVFPRLRLLPQATLPQQPGWSELPPTGIEINMKISSFFAYFVPELRGHSGPQLMKIWSACAPCSQNWVYLHLLLLLACCSLIFNLIIHLNAAPLSMLVGLLLGLA